MNPEEVDTLYEKDIKILYGKILATLIDSELRHGDEVYENLQELKHTNRHLVLALKNI